MGSQALGRGSRALLEEAGEVCDETPAWGNWLWTPYPASEARRLAAAAGMGKEGSWCHRQTGGLTAGGWLQLVQGKNRGWGGGGRKRRLPSLPRRDGVWLPAGVTQRGQRVESSSDASGFR